MQFNYETLNVEFIIDSNLTNWKSLYSWMRNIANIDDDTSIIWIIMNGIKTATLSIYDPISHCSTTTVRFKYIVPTKLSGINFQTDSADAIIQKASCTFKFAYY
jgi:hypothetical protein